MDTSPDTTQVFEETGKIIFNPNNFDEQEFKRLTTPKFGQFTCPSCGSHYFSTSNRFAEHKPTPHSQWINHCKGCSWQGSNEECGIITQED